VFEETGINYKPIALAGRVPCKVSTENGPIKAGDLLTTSSTPGHAMKANEPWRGGIIGTALEDFPKDGGDMHRKSRGGAEGSGACPRNKTGTIVVYINLQPAPDNTVGLREEFHKLYEQERQARLALEREFELLKRDLSISGTRNEYLSPESELPPAEVRERRRPGLALR
jgi:hypothetical protein